MGNYIPIQSDLSSLSFNYFQRGQDWVEGSNCLEQSPIDIIPENAIPSDSVMKMEFFLTDHDLMGLKVHDTGNSLQVNGPFSKLLATDVEGDVYEYEAIQFHFHAPAEHTIKGDHYDLEVHIVHKITPRCSQKGNVKRNLAVVGIFFELDESPNAQPNPFIESLQLHNVGGNITINMNDTLGKDINNLMDYYAYKGSLTVPPCSANANWYVMEKPLKITAEQLEQFNLRWKDNPNYAGGFGNNRTIQPLNGRIVMKSKNCCIMSRSEESVRRYLLEEKMAGTPLASKLKLETDLLFETISLDTLPKIDDSHNLIKEASFEVKPIPDEFLHPIHIQGKTDCHGKEHESHTSHTETEYKEEIEAE